MGQISIDCHVQKLESYYTLVLYMSQSLNVYTYLNQF